MHLRQGELEVTDTDLVVIRLSQLFGSVVDSIELANFVREADVLEDSLNLVSSPWLSELSFSNANLIDHRWEQQLTSLGFITEVLKGNQMITGLTWKLATLLNGLYGMSVLTVGRPKLLALSSSFLTTFLQPGLKALPSLSSGSNSCSVGSP